MERLIAQDPMVITASSRGVMRTEAEQELRRRKKLIPDAG
jgi:hypothetical protein